MTVGLCVYGGGGWTPCGFRDSSATNLANTLSYHAVVTYNQERLTLCFFSWLFVITSTEFSICAHLELLMTK